MGRPDYGLVGGVLDPRVLTIGFARRFATYKRATLMLSDRDRLKRLLFHEERPIQIVLAGKSHPKDDGGKKLIQDLLQFIEHDGARARMVFIEDYDMRVARALVQGVDVWLNNPRRPHEASGTSGMKVVPNAGLNCSILDGWWDEAYEHDLGFAIGDAVDGIGEGQQDWLDSQALYNVLEHEIAPKFYHRIENGLPTAWLAMIKRSIQVLAPQFSTGRMVADYARKSYMPASGSYRRLSDNGLDKAKAVLGYKGKASHEWPTVRVVKVTDDAGLTPSVGKKFCVRAAVALGELDSTEVRVQVVLGKIGPNRDLLDAVPIDMRHVGSEDGLQIFEAAIPCPAPGHQGYIVRIIPDFPDLSVPADLNLVTWEV
jgi:starch phosphorylase